MFTFMGAMGKSAQFPLHTWLPDAMQGPTTGSSIIHAATMVAAGVYMTARISPLLTEGSLFFVAIIGGITAFLAATMALVQWDIKAVLAYSTISQLGYMMIGLGGNAYTAGIAHLFTHAIFKCMLFLCAGSVIHACHHLQDMNRMGGLRKKMPLTYLTMLAGTLAISGVPFFSGFYSKDAILAGSLAKAHAGGIDGMHWIPFLLGIVTALLTTFYMFRLIFMTFHGEPRDQHVYDHAHESPPVATVPLIILATLCLGFWWGGHLIGGDMIGLPGVTRDVAVYEVKGKDAETDVVEKGWVDALMVSPVSLTAKLKPSDAARRSVDGENAKETERRHHTAHLIATLLSILMLSLGWFLAWSMYMQEDRFLRTICSRIRRSRGFTACSASFGISTVFTRMELCRRSRQRTARSGSSTRRFWMALRSTDGPRCSKPRRGYRGSWTSGSWTNASTSSAGRRVSRASSRAFCNMARFNTTCASPSASRRSWCCG